MMRNVRTFSCGAMSETEKTHVDDVEHLEENIHDMWHLCCHTRGSVSVCLCLCVCVNICQNLPVILCVSLCVRFYVSVCLSVWWFLCLY